MAASHECGQRGTGPSCVSIASIAASSGAEGVVKLDTVINDDAVRHRADALDAEAAYYRRRAIQEEQALGPGYYVDLLRGMATDRAALAQRIRTGKAAML